MSSVRADDFTKSEWGGNNCAFWPDSGHQSFLMVSASTTSQCWPPGRSVAVPKSTRDGYLDLVPSENSTGDTVKRGGMTATAPRRKRKCGIQPAHQSLFTGVDPNGHTWTQCDARVSLSAQSVHKNRDREVSGQRCLISGFCSSGRGFAPHFLQTPPRDYALVLC